MTARCVICKRSWNISIYQKIDSSGYVCPQCEAQKHQRRSPAPGNATPATVAGKKGRRKRDEVINNKRFNGSDAPIEIEQMEYLAEEFYSALGYFSNKPTDYIKALVDRP